MYDKIKPSKKRVRKNIAALNSLIETEESIMTKRKFRLKPFIIAAVIAGVSMASLFTVNAATKGAIVKFFMGGEEIEGEYYDYVDKDGFRRISFGAVLPQDEDTYAMIYDVDAPQGQNVRVLTPATNPEFFENIRRYLDDREKAFKKNAAMWDKIEAWKGDLKGDFDVMDLNVRDAVKQEAIEAGIIDPSEVPEFSEPEDYGLVFKDSELCTWEYIYREMQTGYNRASEGVFGGKFLNTGKSGEEKYEEKRLRNGTKAIKHTFYYYVGKEE